ncbi:MAG: 30S ribosomal protein S8 [Candidatus Rehaiarchaeum fermentans]|nr:30S ribosomal protein S8 [Candidatus Rehaiarchaeum fermentans]MCW1297244.1 30S ribosomal protein S8 [Candidatus Rehaiarchaeum fermentans]MCW1302266.1 30S ribosomal protein S8 [Candidatus Rehaiarchaeum fermentans]
MISNQLNALTLARLSANNTAILTPISKLLIGVLNVLQKNEYINRYEIINDLRGGFIKVEIGEKFNECREIRPHYFVKNKDIIKYEKRYLPAYNYGILIISTSKGLITHREALEKGYGGALIAYAY